jgi:hypothetical protein
MCARAMIRRLVNCTAFATGDDKISQTLVLNLEQDFWSGRRTTTLRNFLANDNELEREIRPLLQKPRRRKSFNRYTAVQTQSGFPRHPLVATYIAPERRYICISPTTAAAKSYNNRTMDLPTKDLQPTPPATRQAAEEGELTNERTENERAKIDDLMMDRKTDDD